MAQAQRKPDNQQIIDEICEEFISYCSEFLKVKDFEGKLVLFVPNRPQRRFIRAIVTQWVMIGYIRVVIAKARKMGFSTVITAFMFWRLNINTGLGAIAGTHHQDTNGVLVDIFKRFHDNLPKEVMLTVESRSASGMKYLNFGTEYWVCCASNADNVGRGPTAQMIHVSEIAHIDNAGALCKSLLNAVGGFTKDSMIFLETTANGTENYHYRLFTKAEKRSPGCEYIAFFAAWYEDDRYVKEVPEGFSLTEEELKEKELYDLTDEQMSWRRSMLAQMDGTDEQALAQFRQEYPANSVEAFQYSKTDSFLDADLILKAMNREQYGSHGAIIAGYDPSFKGKDGDAFIYRQGANLWGLETPVFGDNFGARVRYLKEKLDNKVCHIDMLFIDSGGGGYNIYSELRDAGYGSRCKYIEFGSGADNQIKYQWKRDEMFGDFRELLTDKNMPLSISVGDNRDMFLQDLTATGYKKDHKDRPKMEGKETMKARGVGSTNPTDAAILTVAQKIVRKHVASTKTNYVNDNTNALGSLRQRRSRR